jgi:hypothetical protein
MVTGPLFSGYKRPGRKADHPLSTSAEVRKNVNRRCCVVSTTDSLGRILGFPEPESLFFLPSNSFVLTGAEWTQFQTHYFSEVVEIPEVVGMELGPLILVSKTPVPEILDGYLFSIGQYTPVPEILDGYLFSIGQ